jgi:hypothetical protein
LHFYKNKKKPNITKLFLSLPHQTSPKLTMKSLPAISSKKSIRPGRTNPSIAPPQVAFARNSIPSFLAE